MIFEHLFPGYEDRLRQAKIFLSQVEDLEGRGEYSELALSRDSSRSLLAKNYKGFFFVAAYAALEFTVTKCCSEFVSHIKNNGYPLNSLECNLLAFVLEPEFQAVYSCKEEDRLKKKASLVRRVYSSETARVADSSFPGEGMNVGRQQLRDLWDVMNIPGRPFPERCNGDYLDEIKNNRNAVAHGRETAHDIGRRYTLEELGERLEEVKNVCEHVFSSFAQHVQDEPFLVNRF
ncbi:MAE_28990/MAE_18760 family HEPN-like nuclease [Modicisalibacter coralii]|uniref:MAE_28990/MAE_18760 family HEPN-like nuclease n=1 Tax=Modicisalibacter coralii TaxID=2304602 RepID=UPI00100B8B08|nr:MAE_28990/MAE_18760 family HEPN-like nuclease [Halomonas coralii]